MGSVDRKEVDKAKHEEDKVAPRMGSVDRKMRKLYYVYDQVGRSPHGERG